MPGADARGVAQARRRNRRGPGLFRRAGRRGRMVLRADHRAVGDARRPRAGDPAVIDAATLVRRLLARKYPNAGRYLFEPYELQQVIEAVQADAAPPPEDDMAMVVIRRIDDDLWAKLRAQAAAEQIGVRELVLRILTAYVNRKRS